MADVAKTLAEAGTQGATQFGPFGRLALDPRKLSDVAAALFGMAKAPVDAAQNIQQNYRPGAENEIVNQDIGRQAFDAGSVIMGGAPMVEKGAVGAFGGKLDPGWAERAAVAERKGFDPSTVYYHGTEHDFDKPRGRFFVTEDPKMASKFADTSDAQRGTNGGRVIPYYLKREGIADLTSKADLERIAQAQVEQMHALGLRDFTVEKARAQLADPKNIKDGRVNWAVEPLIDAARRAGFSGVPVHESWGRWGSPDSHSIAMFNADNLRPPTHPDFDIGRQALDAGSVAMAGAPFAEVGAVGSMGGKPPRLDWDTPLPTRVENPIKAYHGSPHDFDAFDAAHIGKGEGAQAYGHGLYFAEAEPVARQYRDAISATHMVGPQGNPVGKAAAFSTDDLAARVLSLEKGDFGKALNSAKYDLGMATEKGMADHINQWQSVVDTLGRWQKDGVKSTQGKMYEVALHATPEQFLDWDKPLSQQSEGVGKGIRGILGDDRPLPPEPTLYERTQADLTGQKAIERLSRRYSPYRVGEVLREAGIPGIRYKDQLSRDPLITDSMVYKGSDGLWGFDDKLTAGHGLTGNRFPNKAEAMAALTAEMKPVAPTSNYVVFPGNEHIIEIMKKYGVTAPVAAYMLSQQSGDQQ